MSPQLDPRLSLWRQATATLNTYDTPAQPSHEEIAARAYARYVSRHDGDGSPALDWIEAERELTLQRRGIGSFE